MNLFQLEYFVTVAEELHFARAAERLHVAQPSLSFQIKQLEDEIKVRLFNRTTRRVELTEAGQAFLEKVQVSLRTLQEGVDTAQRIERGEEGALTLGYNGYTLYNIMPTLLQAFRIHHPHAQLSVREVYAPELDMQLLSESLDAALAIMDASSNVRVADSAHTDMAWLPLMEERMYIALHRDHLLSQHETVQLSMLREENFIVMDRVQKPNAYAQTIQFCQSGGFFPNIAQEALSIEAGVGLVAAGAGVAFATESMRELRTDKVSYRLLIAPEVIIRYGLVWKRSYTSPLLHSLVQLAQSLFDLSPKDQLSFER